MNMHKEKKKNLIILFAFAAILSVALIIGVKGDRAQTIATAIINDRSDLMAVENADTVVYESESGVQAVCLNADGTETALSDDIEESAGLEDSETTVVEAKENAAELSLTAFTVTEYDTVAKMFASDTVNVRSGAGTDYDKLGKVTWGTEISVTGVTDNGWFEVLYNDLIGYIRGDYMVSEMPGVPFLFVGDSRTVQLQNAVGSTDKAYIAKIGEGYSYFKNTALPAIPEYAGQGTVMIINFGVNDLANANKYIKLVNSNIDAWTSAGITVYYASVTPVGSACASVSNAQIESFNNKLKEGLDPRVQWIDSYSYLSQVGFSSSDGLHYSKDTYKNLYAYYVSVIQQNQDNMVASNAQ